jgi:hypothetical protein
MVCFAIALKSSKGFVSFAKAVSSYGRALKMKLRSPFPFTAVHSQ